MLVRQGKLSQSKGEMVGGSGGEAFSLIGSWCGPLRLILHASTRKSFPCPSLHRHSEHWPEALTIVVDGASSHVKFCTWGIGEISTGLRLNPHKHNKTTIPVSLLISERKYLCME